MNALSLLRRRQLFVPALGLVLVLAIALFALVSGGRSAQALGPFTLLQTINTGQAAFGIVLDSSGDIRTTHNLEGTIKTHTPAGVQTGNFVFSTTPFESPDGLDIDAAGNNVVVDGNEFTIKTFTAGGTLVDQFSVFTANSFEVVVEASGNLLVSHNYFISRYTPGGTKLADIGSGVFTSFIVGGIGLDSLGNIYAVQPLGTPSVHKFDSSGTHLASFPVPANSKDVAVDGAGNMYVTTINVGINVFSPTGTLLGTIPLSENLRGIEVDSSGKIYVVGTSGKIRIYGPSNEAPDCSSAAPSSATLWPPNHKFHSVSVNGVTDADGDAVTITIDGITQDEPVNGKGDGNTSPDGAGVGTDTAEVRAERSGKGDGRVYEISFTADDGNGGTCEGSVNVGVPHDKKDTPTDSGQDYDSTAS